MTKSSVALNEEAQDAVVRKALNSLWNAYGGERVRDTPDREVCQVARCGLDQGILAGIESWDTEDVFGRSHQVRDNPLNGRAVAMLASLRRVVDKGVADGVLVHVTLTHMYALGVTFAEGREL